MVCRHLSSKSNYSPVGSYKDSLANKKPIFAENKNKCLVYRWVNDINGKTYIGSTINFQSRFYKYYNVEYLKRYNTPLHSALLKYGFNNFSLDIIEYCNKNDVIEREQYYFNLLKPEYNILQVAGSSLGFKHSEDTLKYFKDNRKLSPQAKHKLSLAASNRIFTELEKNKLSEVRKGIKLSDLTKNKISSSITSLVGVPVSVRDTETGVQKNYASLTEAAINIGISRTAIKKSCVTGNILKKRYYVKIVKK